MMKSSTALTTAVGLTLGLIALGAITSSSAEPVTAPSTAPNAVLPPASGPVAPAAVSEVTPVTASAPPTTPAPSASAPAGTPVPPPADNAPVVVSGIVPDQATHDGIITRTRELYGDRVVDQLKLGRVRIPPNWGQVVMSSLQPSLKSVTQGRLSVNGPSINLYGNVTTEQTRTDLGKQLTQGLPAAYQVTNNLDVVAPEQAIVDRALANRIVEFESGSATLTSVGTAILDEMATALNRVGGRSVKIIGHTDNQGSPETNQALSLSRAEAVKAYLATKGVKPTSLSTQGLGSTKPVADNANDEGRRRNRRIEFDVI